MYTEGFRPTRSGLIGLHHHHHRGTKTMRRKPRFLVCQVTVSRPVWSGDVSDAADRTTTCWFTLETEEQVAELPQYEKCGFGTENVSVTYEVHEIQVTEQRDDVTATPRTVKDEALRMAAAG